MGYSWRRPRPTMLRPCANCCFNEACCFSVIRLLSVFIERVEQRKRRLMLHALNAHRVAGIDVQDLCPGLWMLDQNRVHRAPNAFRAPKERRQIRRGVVTILSINMLIGVNGS